MPVITHALNYKVFPFKKENIISHIPAGLSTFFWPALLTWRGRVISFKKEKATIQLWNGHQMSFLERQTDRYQGIKLPSHFLGKYLWQKKLFYLNLLQTRKSGRFMHYQWSVTINIIYLCWVNNMQYHHLTCESVCDPLVKILDLNVSTESVITLFSS